MYSHSYKHPLLAPLIPLAWAYSGSGGLQALAPLLRLKGDSSSRMFTAVILSVMSAERRYAREMCFNELTNGMFALANDINEQVCE